MKFLKIFIIVVALALVIGGGALFWWFRSGGLQNFFIKGVSTHLGGNTNEINLIQDFLGLKAPKTYLVLFLNNTELRPGGGFIGSYAVVRITNGQPEVLKVEGTEILDGNAPKNFVSEPPAPLKDYLKVNRWNFRDSNWSPDFAVSCQKALELFKLENGTAADSINAVIGFTPTLVEYILAITGPLSAGGEEFNAKNFTEKLEYEVEYGYAQKGLSFDERKQLLQTLVHAFTAKLKTDLFLHWGAYWDMLKDALAQKQLVFYATDPAYEEALHLKNWSGEMRPVSGDYLLWADANLASLKTDLAIERELKYSIIPTTTGFVGQVRMKYVHRGAFDWRTTRYRTYARVFLPAGSRLVRVSGALKNDRTTEKGRVDAGVENGRQWLGAFIAVEPGKTGELMFEFTLAPQIVDQIKKGEYTLLAQKQIGTIANRLVLDLDFGKAVAAAVPPEAVQNFGDKRYGIITDLKVDREFEIKFK